MAMDPIQVNWLSVLIKKDIAGVAKRKADEHKDAILSQTSSQVVKHHKEILDGFNIEVSVGKKKQKLLDYGNRDQTQEFDIEEQIEGYSIAEEDMEKHNHALLILNKLGEQLDTATTPAFDPETGDPILVDELDDQGNPIQVDELDAQNAPTGNKVNKKVQKQVPLFGDKEKSELFYKPLVRQGLCPETFVPDKYSETKEMIDGSFAPYADRLKREGTDLKPYEIIKESAKWVGTAASFAATIAGGALMTIDTVHTPTDATNYFSDHGLTIDNANGTTSDVNAWTHPLDNAGIDLGSDSPERGAQLVMEAVMSGVGGSLDAWEDEEIVREGVVERMDQTSEQLEEQDKENQEKQHHEKKKKPRIAKAGATANYLATSIAAALNEAFKASGLEPAVGNAYSTFAETKKAAKLLAKPEFKSDDATAAMQVYADAFELAILKCDPKVGQSTQILTDLSSAIASKFMSRVNGATLKSDLDAGKFDVVLGTVTKWAKSAALLATGAPLGDDDDQTGDTTAAPIAVAFNQFAGDPNNQDLMQARSNESVTHQLAHELDEDSEKAKKEALELKAETDLKKKAGLIDRQIKVLQREKALLGLATSVAGMGFEVASKFLAPLAVGGSLVKLSVNIAKAANRAKDAYDALQSQEDFFQDASAFSAPLANFVHNGEMHATHYSIQAAAEFVKMVGAIIECTGGYQAIAGRLISVTASSAQTIESVLYEVRLRYNLELGWKAYRRALIRPENRKLGLEAMKSNPTLAKYAVAWGAVIRKDPLVADFIGATGLTVAALEEEGASVDKVQKYLEVRFSDDKVAVGRKVVADDWAPTPVEPTVVFWKTCVQRAKTKADLLELKTDEIDACLVRLQNLEGQLKKKVKFGDLRGNGIKACNDLISALRGVNPQRLTDKKKVPHHEMVGIIEELIRMSDEHRAEFEKLPVPK